MDIVKNHLKIITAFIFVKNFGMVFQNLRNHKNVTTQERILVKFVPGSFKWRCTFFRFRWNVSCRRLNISV